MANRLHRLREAFRPAAPGAAHTATNLQMVSRLVTENARPYLRRYFTAFLCAAIASGCTALSAWIIEDVVNEIFVHRRLGTVLAIAGAVAGIFLVKGLSSYAHATILARIGNNLVAQMQERIYRVILAQSLGFFQQRKSGDLVARLVTNAESARGAIDNILLGIGRDLLTLLGLLCVMAIKDPVLTLAMILITPVVAFFVSRLTKRIRVLAAKEFEHRAQVIATLQETTTGAGVIKAYTLEPHMQMRALDAIAGIERRNNRIARLQARVSPITETLGGLAFASVILYGGLAVIERSDHAGAFFAFLTALLLAVQPAKKLARLRVELEHRLYGVRLMYAIIDRPPDISDPPDARALKVRAGRVAFDSVCFRYPGAETPALDNCSMVAEAGSTTALVGPSGAGKSTSFSLIVRFFAAQSGTICVDDQNVNTITAQSLREQVALVTQDTFLFAGTVAENLRVGRADATDREIETAARDAHAHEFITALPDGYDTEIGERGALLSGGERQRLAIARALLRDAPVLLLDEPTSSLDAASESHVQAALERLMRGRTTIVIAHRLSTVRNADMIHVMDRGRLVQSGTHTALLEEGGLYARLHALQFQEPANGTDAGGADGPPDAPGTARTPA